MFFVNIFLCVVINYVQVCVSTRGYVNVSVQVQEEAGGIRSPGVSVTDRCELSTWLLGRELRFSERETSVLNH